MRMHEVELRIAALNLEHALRTMKFTEGQRHFVLGFITASHPVDIDGQQDFSYLVYEFEKDLPAFYIHEAVQSAGAYADILAAQGVAPETVRKWVACLRNDIEIYEENKVYLPLHMKVFRAVYFFLQPVLFFLFLVAHLREGLPMQRFSERLGLDSMRPSGNSTIWLHAASLGEIKQLRPIIAELSRCAGVKVLVTTFTKSSAAWLEAEFPHIAHRYAVMDGRRAVRRFLDVWQPEVVIIAENETWPEMIIQSAERGALLLKVGVRPSRTLRRFPKFAKSLLALFSKVACTSPTLMDELVGMGVERNRIAICADQRNSGAILPVDEAMLSNISHQVDERPLWLAASTHEADHEIVLDAHAYLSASENRLLILAPRHPRTAEAIKKSCRKKGLVVAQRSMNEGISAATQVYLADTLGELGLFFTLSSVVYLGGGLGAEGGHNPYEPASFGCEILSGPHVENFRDAFASIASKTKVTFVETAAQLAAEVVAHETSRLARPERRPLIHAFDPFQIEAVDVVIAATEWFRPTLITRIESSS